MKKKNPRPKHTMPRHEAGEREHEPPSPQAILEARRAQEAADRNPLAYSLGEPLPGRSALDKMRAQAVDAGAEDSVIVLRTASEIENDRRAAKGYPPKAPSNRRIMNTISPGRFITSGRARED